MKSNKEKIQEDSKASSVRESIEFMRETGLVPKAIYRLLKSTPKSPCYFHTNRRKQYQNPYSNIKLHRQPKKF